MEVERSWSNNTSPPISGLYRLQSASSGRSATSSRRRSIIAAPAAVSLNDITSRDTDNGDDTAGRPYSDHNNRTHQRRHSSYQPERSCGEEICTYAVHLKRTGCYAGFPEGAFKGRDEPRVRSNGSICKGIPLKRTNRGKSGERL